MTYSEGQEGTPVLEQSEVTPEHPVPVLIPPLTASHHMSIRPRGIFSWVTAVAIILMIALIATTLVASHHPPAGRAGTGQGGSTSPAPLSRISVYGLAWPPNSQVNGNIFVLNGADGTLRWRYPTPNAIETMPVVEHGVFYTGASDGHIYAFDANTGKLLWNIKLPNRSFVWQVVAGVVYATSLDNLQTNQPGRYGVYALDARSGKQLWQFTKGGSICLVADGIVYVTDTHDIRQPAGTLYALDANTGAERWHFQGQGSLYAWFATGGQVYVMGNRVADTEYNVTSILYVIDATQGLLRWSYPGNPAGLQSPLGVENGMVYLFSTTRSPLLGPVPDHLSALSAGDGSLRWQVTIPSEQSQAVNDVIQSSAGPTLSNGVIYLGSETDPLSAYNASDGSLLWSNPQIQNASVETVANGVVYVLGEGYSGDWGLYALDAITGRLLWKYAGMPLLVEGVVNGVVFASSFAAVTSQAAGNGIYALNAGTGKVRWLYPMGQETATITVQ